MAVRGGARVGAAVFVLGLWAAGPQAGVALADDVAPDAATADTVTPRSVRSNPGAASAPATRARRSGVAAAEAAAPVRNRPAPAAAVTSSSAVTIPVIATSAPSVSVPAAVAAQARRRAVALTPPPAAATVVSVPAASAAKAADPMQAINTAVAGMFDSAQNLLSALPGGPVSDLLSGALLLVRRTLLPGSVGSSQTSVAAVAATNGWVGAAPSDATLAVTNWFGGVRQWLNSFDNPLAAAVQGALVGVQNTLFSPVAVVRPVQLTAWTPGDPILGELQYVQPGGAGVSFQVTQAPTLGTVELRSDGTYTYTAGANFTGTDSFTAQVTSAGFNILDPLAPRTSTVTVNINPAALTQLTRGFDITNLTGKAVYVQKIIKESGYENSVEAAPSVGRILQPGETTHVELTRYAFYSYYTLINFSSCSDIACTSYKEGAAGPWQVSMYVQLLNSYRGDCKWNNCWNGSSQEIGPWSPNGFYGLDNSVIKLVDRPNTAYTLTGAEGQQQANVLNTVCTAQGTTCQFVPTANTQYTTKPQQVYKYTNSTQDNQTVNQGATETVSATSSFGTTYSTEVSATFGQKDVFNFVAKQTFTSTQSLSNTTQKTTNWSVNTIVRPGNVLTTTLDVPVARVTGDYTAVIGNTTYNLTGVYFDFIDPNAPAQLHYTSATAPIAG